MASSCSSVLQIILHVTITFMIPKQKQEFVKDALFISYTGLKDFLKCPKSYYLKNRYKDPKSGNKIQITSPYLTLGSLVHDAIKWYLQTGRTAKKDDVIKNFRNRWLKYRGKRGGFASVSEEGDFGRRGLQMLDNFFKNTDLEQNIPLYDFLRFRLNDKIFFNGKLDFLGQLPDGSLHVLDFKTGTKEEDDSMQLHAYAILAQSALQKVVSKISYWYLDKDTLPKEAVLDPLEGKLEWIQEKCKGIERAVLENDWACIKGENLCNDCRNYQSIIDGKGEFQFTDEAFKKDIYYLDRVK